MDAHLRPRNLRSGPVVAALLVAATAAAQTRFAPFHRDHLQTDLYNTLAAVLADLDGDGDADLVFGTAPANALVLNLGRAVFRDASTLLPPTIGSSRDLAAVDVDGDGDLDLVVAVAFRAAPNRLWLNDGSGRFVDSTAQRMPARRDDTRDVVTGDVDGDGDADLVFGNFTSQNTLYLNDGAGGFTDVTATHLPSDPGSGFSVWLVDVDGDRDLDLVTAGLSRANALYLNDGHGAFTDASQSRMPAGELSYRVRAADVDADGDADLVFASVERRQNRLFLNDGGGYFRDVTATQMPVDDDTTADLDVGDVDGDGDPDIVFANDEPSKQDRLYLNDGTGVFRDATTARMPADAEPTAVIRLGDVDGDGDLDLVAGHGLPHHPDLFLNDGAGRFYHATETGLPVDSDRSQGAAIGDVDGDGDADLVFANVTQSRLLLGDATGRFVDATAQRWPIERTDNRDIALVDVDADGDLDALIALVGTPYVRQYENDGLGVFADVTASRMPPGPRNVLSLAVGDVDRDGDPDLVLGALDESSLYLNDGSGTFTDVTSTALPRRPRHVEAAALGDVDGDGDIDIVFASNGGQDSLLINDGTGRFGDETAARMPVDSAQTISVALADVDLDGDPDLVLGAWFGPNRLYENDGTGTFVDVSTSRIPPGPSSAPRGIGVGDFDDDGDPDLVFVYQGQQNRYYDNDGTGSFIEATGGLPSREDTSFDVAVGDVDSDGDLDLVVANQDPFGNSVLLNRHRQLRAPLLPRRGVPFDLEIQLEPAGAPQFLVAVGVMGTGTVAVPVPPFGVWRIDPLGSGPLPLLYVPPRARSVALPIAIPPSPALRGFRVHFQVALVDPVRGAHLSGLVSETVL